MRKFYKILFLILTLVIATTAFAVVSLAEETKQPYEFKQGDYATFNSYEVGSHLCYGRNAQAIITLQDNGNKYVLAQKVEGNTTSNPQWDITYTLGNTYNIVDYPYYMIDFDIMTLSGSYYGHSVNIRPNPTGGTFLDGVDFNSLGLSTDAYDWSHLSIIIEYQGNGQFIKHAYINGKWVKSIPKDLSANSLFTDGNDKNVVLRSMKFYPTTSGKVGYDNMRFTYFPAGYASGDDDVIKTIANHNYNNGEDYEFPYKFTVATLTDNETGVITYYDNYEDAYAAKNEGNTFKTMYAAEIIDANGKSTYVTDADFASKFNSLADGATIRLHQDIVVDTALTFNSKTATLDLNGYEIQCTAEISDPEGNFTYISDKDFASGFNNLANGATMKLHNDVVVDTTLTFNSSRTTTLDLNGHKMYRLGRTFTDYKAIYNEETGEYEKGEALESPAAVNAGNLFYLGKGSTVFNLTSSRPGAEIYSVGITAERLLLDGKVVASTVTAKTSSNIFSNETTNNTVNVDGKNITFYANSFFYGGHGGGTNLKLNIDGGVYVKIHTSTNAILHLFHGGTHVIKNAIFVSDNYVYRHQSTTTADVTFENCDFLGGHVIFGNDSTHVNGNFTMINCRVKLSVGNVYSTVTVGENTWLASDYAQFANAENNERVSNVKTFYYTVPNKTISVDPITLLPYVTTKNTSQTYNYLVSDPSKSIATVTYKDWEGNVIKVATLLKGDTATPPTLAIPTGDGYTGYGVTTWLDKNGNAFDHVITYDDEQVYTAVRPTEENDVIAYITEARMNFSYVAQFHMYFYLPIKDGMTKPVLTGNNPSDSSGTDLIDGQNYWVYTWWCSASTISENTNFTVNYEIDGVQYTQSFAINALLYANIVLSDPASDEEAAAVANMVRYVKEARIASGKSVGQEFDKLIGSEGLYPNLPDYPETYPDDSLDTSVIAPYIDYFTLSISDTPKFVLCLSQNAIDLGMTRDNFKLVTKDGKLLELYDYAKNGKNYETNNTKIYNLAKTFTVTVTVPAVTDAETGEIITESFKVSCDYSIGTYIKGVTTQNPEANVNLAKATYAFALAVEAYRNSVTNY